ncbi:hypothetical protein HHI36_013110 [Cryptolaemus montrouzieri]|uniref:Uncharacterized protein n=1 Tax=Cryptolaemus montrouzieri TaxID=559131 RepID=A0ABD2NGD2_9CUCU
MSKFESQLKLNILPIHHWLSSARKPKDYKFEYGVSDPHTGDHKSHWEVRENGVVRGEYSLLEPDGTTRVVQYTADDHNGFRAVVKRIGHSIHPLNNHHSNLQSNSIIIQDAESHSSEPYYKAYDGGADNYINVLDDSSQASLISGGLYDRHEISPISLLPPHLLGAEIPSLSLDEHSVSLLGSYPSVGIPKAEGLFAEEPLLIHQKEPIKVHETLHLQEPVIIPESSHISEIPSSSASKEEPVSIGIKIEHPHGESSASFIGSTGNLEDDSAYTNYAKGIPSVALDILGSSLPSSMEINSYKAELSYPYLRKRSIKKEST